MEEKRKIRRSFNGCRGSGGELATAAPAIGVKAAFDGAAKIVCYDLWGQNPGAAYTAAFFFGDASCAGK